MFKNDVFGNPHNVEINFDHYLKLESLQFHEMKKPRKKMLSIDISHIYGG